MGVLEWLKLKKTNYLRGESLTVFALNADRLCSIIATPKLSAIIVGDGITNYDIGIVKIAGG